MKVAPNQIEIFVLGKLQKPEDIEIKINGPSSSIASTIHLAGSGDKKKRKNTALERRLSAYPPMAFVKMLTAFAHESILSKSAVETKIIREFFTALPVERQRELIAIYDRLTPAQRNRPGSIRENEE